MNNNRLTLLIRFACVLLTICLSGCAHYSPTTSNPAKVDSGRLYRSWFDWDGFCVTQIDGQPVEHLFQTSDKVDAGQHLLLIFHKGNRPYGGFVSAGYLPVIAHFEPSKRYDVAGSESAGVIRVWIRDVENGKAVSEAIERPVMPIQGQSAPIFVPIVVPHR